MNERVEKAVEVRLCPQAGLYLRPHGCTSFVTVFAPTFRVVRSHRERRPGAGGLLDLLLRRKPILVIDEVFFG